MFTSPITRYSVERIYTAIKDNNTSAINAVTEAQYQHQLFRNWCHKLGQRAYPKGVL